MTKKKGGSGDENGPSVAQVCSLNRLETENSIGENKQNLLDLQFLRFFNLQPADEGPTLETSASEIRCGGYLITLFQPDSNV